MDKVLKPVEIDRTIVTASGLTIKTTTSIPELSKGADSEFDEQDAQMLVDASKEGTFEESDEQSE